MKERRFRTFTSNLIICVVLGAVLVTALFAVTDAGEAVITGGAVYEGDRDGGKVALMFNVYEGTEYVEKIARLLSERGMSATFFLGGIWAERNGDTVIRLAADGFELGNHGYLHRDHAALSAERNRSEIVVTERLLSATLSDLPSEERAAALPKLFAPPSGSMGDAMHAVCEELGYTVVMWTRDTIDWRDHDAPQATSSSCTPPPQRCKPSPPSSTASPRHTSPPTPSPPSSEALEMRIRRQAEKSHFETVPLEKAA